MRGHHHSDDPSLTQNQGNLLGDRPCVRQSRLYRERDGGNAMKELMGRGVLKWDTTQTEGVYVGGKVFDHKKRKLSLEEAKEKKENCKESVYSVTGVVDKSNHVKNYTNNINDNMEKENSGNEVVITMDIAEDNASDVFSTEFQRDMSAVTQKQMKEDKITKVDGRNMELPEKTPIASRGFRKGAGHANLQTYNIFTGK